MHFTKSLIVLTAALLPSAFAALQAAEPSPSVTSTITLVPSGYTSTSSTPISTPSSTSTSTSSTVVSTSSSTSTSVLPSWTPKPTSIPHGSSSMSRVPHSTPLIMSTSTFVQTNTVGATDAASAATASPTHNSASMHQVSGAMAAGVVAIAGMLLV